MGSCGGTKERKMPEEESKKKEEEDKSKSKEVAETNKDNESKKSLILKVIKKKNLQIQ
jgi:hypothetical protein